jgi:hypothetical protein
MEGMTLLTSSSSTMGDEIVTLLVGSDKFRFIVHKNILCSKVKYFDRLFNGNFMEATAGEASFPEDDAAAFDALLAYIYTDNINSYSKNESYEFSFCLQLYVLADKLGPPDLQDLCVDAIFNYTTFPGISHSRKLPAFQRYGGQRLEMGQDVDKSTSTVLTVRRLWC